MEYDDIQCMELLDGNYQYYMQLVPHERFWEVARESSVAVVRYVFHGEWALDRSVLTAYTTVLWLLPELGPRSKAVLFYFCGFIELYYLNLN